MADQDPGVGLTAEAMAALESIAVGPGKPDAAKGSDAAIRKAAAESALAPLDATTTAGQALAIAKGAVVTGDDDRALKAAGLAVQKSPDDPEARLTYAWSFQKTGASLTSIIPLVQDAAKLVVASTSSNVMSWVYISLSYLYLYQNPPEGFERAIQVLTEYDDKKGPDNADIELNRACALGQKYKYLTGLIAPSDVNGGKGSTNDEIKNVRDLALAAVKKSLKLDPSEITRMKELMWVTSDPQDDDLAAFQKDREFAELIPRS